MGNDRRSPEAQTTGELLVHVRREGGIPLEGARVEVAYVTAAGGLQSLGGSDIRQAAPTNAQGMTRIPLYLSPERTPGLRISVSCEGYTSRSVSVARPLGLQPGPIEVILRGGQPLAGTLLGIDPLDHREGRFKLRATATVDGEHWSIPLIPGPDGRFSTNSAPSTPLRLSFTDQEDVYEDCETEVAPPFASVLLEVRRTATAGRITLSVPGAGEATAIVISPDRKKVIARRRLKNETVSFSVPSGHYRIYIAPDFRQAPILAKAARGIIDLPAGATLESSLTASTGTSLVLNTVDGVNGKVIPEYRVELRDEDVVLESFRINSADGPVRLSGLLPGLVLAVSSKGFRTHETHVGQSGDRVIVPLFPE